MAAFDTRRRDSRGRVIGNCNGHEKNFSKWWDKAANKVERQDAKRVITNAIKEEVN